MVGVLLLCNTVVEVQEYKEEKLSLELSHSLQLQST